MAKTLNTMKTNQPSQAWATVRAAARRTPKRSVPMSVASCNSTVFMTPTFKVAASALRGAAKLSWPMGRRLFCYPFRRNSRIRMLVTITHTAGGTDSTSMPALAPRTPAAAVAAKLAVNVAVELASWAF